MGDFAVSLVHEVSKSVMANGVCVPGHVEGESGAACEGVPVDSTAADS